MSYKVTKSTKLIMFPTTFLDLLILVDTVNIVLFIWSRLSEDQRKMLTGG